MKIPSKRKLFYWFTALILSPILLVFLLGIALYIPFVQNWARGLIEREASASLAKTVRIESLHLGYPLNLKLEGVHVLNAPQDTMVSMGHLELGVSPMALMDRMAIVPYLGLKDFQFNQIDTLKQTSLKLKLKEAELRQMAIAWEKEEVRANSLQTDGLSVYYHSADTTESQSDTIRWKIDLEKSDLRNSTIDIGFPRDSIYTKAQVPSLSSTQLRIDLGDMMYQAKVGKLADASVLYHNGRRSSSRAGLMNYDRLELKAVNLELEQLKSHGTDLEVMLKNVSAQERSGFVLKRLQGLCQMDSLQLKLIDWSMATEQSSLQGHVKLPFAMLRGDSTVFAELGLDARIAWPDVMMLAGASLPQDYQYLLSRERIPAWLRNNALHLRTDVEGTLKELTLQTAQLKWSEVLDLSLHGTLYRLNNISSRRGRLELSGRTNRRLSDLLSVLGLSGYQIPNGLSLKGSADLMKGHILLDLLLRHQHERVNLQAKLDEQTKSYRAKISLHDVNARNYMPTLGLGLVDAEVALQGRGYDLFSRATTAQLKGQILQAQYQSLALRDITFDGAMRRGELNFNLNSFNRGLDFSLILDAVVSRSKLQSSVILNANNINLSALNVAPLLSDVQMNLQGELTSDLKDTHLFKASAEGMQFTYDGELIRPNQVDLQVRTNTSASNLILSSGDLRLALNLGDAPTRLMKRADELERLGRRWWHDVRSAKPMQLKLEQLVAQFPELDLDVEMGTDNALRAYLLKSRMSLEALEGQVRLRPHIGIDGHLLARDLRQDTLRINCLNMSINTERIPRHLSLGKSQSDSLRFIAQIKIDKTRFRQQAPFTLSLNLNTSLQDAYVSLDHRGEGGVIQNKGRILADWSQADYRLQVPDTVLVLAGKTMLVNDGNWFNLSKANYFFSGNLNLTGQGTRESLSFVADHREAKEQEAMLSMQGIALQDYRSLGLPNLSGTLSGDINYSRSGDIHQQPVISGDLAIQELSYEKKLLGHFAMALFYQPRADGTHDVTTEISYRGKQALSINGVYNPKSKEPLKAKLSLQDFPLEIANPFTSAYHTYLGGSVNGDLQLGGTFSSPILTGELEAKRGKIELQDYATTLVLDSLPLRVDKDRILFENYALHSSVDLDHPLRLNGYVHTHGASMLMANLQITANEVKLMDQMRPKLENQLLYGRLISSADLRLSGALSSPRVRGRLDVLSGTSCTYVMKESVLDNSDKSIGLVEFKDFADTLFLDKAPVNTRELGGMDINMAIHIDPTVRFNVNLSSDGKDYMNMQGGGTMQFRYFPYGEMALHGRYDMSGGGTLQYTLPVVGSKQFSIDPSGYIAFDGDVSNPLIDFQATQRVRASAGDGSSGKTNFDVSIKAKNRIDNINLDFDLAAPENLSIQNRLIAMSREERSKQAIGLLATGTFLGGNNSNNLDLNETFATLLQNQINTVAGSLLSGTDLSLGMNLNDGGIAGVNQASYTYSFSRRFYNDRIRVVIGGKIQTGENAVNNSQQFIDNVSLEYQMDKAGERFMQVYHKRITDNVIEGEYSETGAGLLLRRKLSKLSDLFRFKKKKTLPPDSTRGVSTRLFALPSKNEE